MFGVLRTDEPAFAVYSGTDWHWREYCARHHSPSLQNHQITFEVSPAAS
jgi:hypothetical protein